MEYAPDVDLEFFKECSSEELNDLVEILTCDPENKSSRRFNTGLPLESLYKEHYPDHAKYWHLIAADLQTFGGNTLATMFRGGKGVFYREILCDVCKKLKVNFNEKSKTQVIEWNLLQKIVEESLNEMSDKEISELFKEGGINNGKMPVGGISAAAVATIFRMGGFQSYKLTVMIANYLSRLLIGKGLTFAGNAALTRTASVVFGPIGWTVTGVWTLIDIASPAYRVTVPAVIKVATMRLMKEKLKDEQALIQE